jgi:hypothetical protein
VNIGPAVMKVRARAWGRETGPRYKKRSSRTPRHPHGVAARGGAPRKTRETELRHAYIAGIKNRSDNLQRLEKVNADSIVNLPLPEVTSVQLEGEPSAMESSWAVALKEWPRFMQMMSIASLILVTILSTAEIISPGLGLGLGFLDLAVLFFANYASWRKGMNGWFVGPHVAMIGSWCSFVIAFAIAVNALWL